jgi:Predicted membrane protein
MLFIKTLLTIFIAEMGDKTQFLLIAMASKYKWNDIIPGTAIAIAVLNGLAVCIGSVLNKVLPFQSIKLCAGFAFLYFAYVALYSNEIEKPQKHKGKFGKKPLFTIFGTFFLAELGDKTQLTALTFAASEGTHHAITVFIACSVGLFAADMIGLAIGYVLKAKLPRQFLSSLSYGIFTIFGLITFHQALHIFHLNGLYNILTTIIVSVSFGLISLRKILKTKETRYLSNGAWFHGQKTER